MTRMILSMSDIHKHGTQRTTELMQVAVHIYAEVLTPNVAQQRANVWLTMNAGHLLQVNNPELILGDMLQ